jgi:quercetin dioxygenase-like cupin family protein
MQLFNWAGVKREVLNDHMSRKVITGERAMIAEINITQDGVVPLHHHESEQLSYCLEGVLKLEVEGKEFVIHPGEVLVIPSNVPHSARALEDFRGFDIFSPIRHDWLDGTDTYLRKK